MSVVLKLFVYCGHLMLLNILDKKEKFQKITLNFTELFVSWLLEKMKLTRIFLWNIEKPGLAHFL